MSSHAPTIDDLRVKVCYICRDEEDESEPSTPPRVWVHPCTCTLIAHESCLLHWIQTSQHSASSTSRRNALKCPQCGTAYQIDSDNPMILRVMEWVSDKGRSLGSVVGMLGGAAVGGGLFSCKLI